MWQLIMHDVGFGSLSQNLVTIHINIHHDRLLKRVVGLSTKTLDTATAHWFGFKV